MGQALQINGIHQAPTKPTENFSGNVIEIGRLLAQSGYFTDIKDMAQAVAKILAGQELGIGPIASLGGVYIQNGRPCYSANVIAAAIKRSGRYNFIVRELTDTKCTLAFTEHGKEVGISTFDTKDAERAGLLGKEVWRKYPRNLLFARALTNGARWHCADIGSGVGLYTPEELEAPVNSDGEVLEGQAQEPVRYALRAPEDRETQVPPPTSPHDEEVYGKKQQSQPRQAQQGNENPLTESMLKMLVINQKRAGITDETIHEYLRTHYSVSSRKEIKQKDLNGILQWIEAQRGEAKETPEPGSNE